MKKLPSCDECGENETILTQVSNFNDVKFLCNECYHSKYLEENSNKVLNYAEINNVITTPKAFHRLLKFKVCLTATTMQANIHKAEPIKVTVISSGLKLKTLIIPGALENPIARKRAACVVLVFGSGNNLTPTK